MGHSESGTLLRWTGVGRRRLRPRTFSSSPSAVNRQPEDIVIPSPQDPRFGTIPLPDKFQSFRPEQWDMITDIMDRFESGTDVIFLTAPTGSGKTLIAETVRRLLKTRAYYTCSTKTLQDQFAHDFPYSKVLKGRRNYLTQSGNLNGWGEPRPEHQLHLDSAITCADCTGRVKKEELDDRGCVWCTEVNQCPFQVAKFKLLESPLAVVNSHLLLADRSLDRRPFVIADEADLLERTLLDQVSIDIPPTRMAVYGLRPPDKKTVESSWLAWAKYAYSIVMDYYEDLPDGHDIYLMREYKHTANLLDKLETLQEELPRGKWVYDGYNRDPDHVIFKPVSVAKYAPKVLWDRGEKWLLMSATFVSPLLTAERLGLFETDKSWDEVEISEGFPPENRPVFVVPVADMTFKKKRESYPEMAGAIDAVLRRHKDDRVLVHTNSYELADYLHGDLSARGHGDRLHTYKTSSERQAALDAYSRTRGTVLLAPSMDRGIDLPDDLCRVQVIAKVPWPNTADKQINAIVHSDGGQAWYTMQAVRTIEQATGRGMRHKDDQVCTYILDKQFSDNLWKKADYMFDDWWKAAVRWDMSPMQLELG